MAIKPDNKHLNSPPPSQRTQINNSAEELRSINEELETRNEELQALNNELRSKLEEVSRAHSDLENLMDATQIATIFLDSQLKIRRFSQGMMELFNVGASDHGRLLSDLTHKLNYDKLVSDAGEVLQTLGIIERETSTTDGVSLLIRLRPYRTVDDRIDGVVISFVDITDSKAAEIVRQSYESFYTLFHANPIPSMLTELETNTILNVNQAFLKLQQQQLTREDVIGRKAEEFSLKPGVTTSASQDSDATNNEQTLTLPSGEKKTLLISTQRVFIDDKDAILSTFTDITKRAQSEEQTRTLNVERVTAEMRERRRIAELLHNDLQQRIFAIKMHLERLEDGMEKQDTPAVKEDFAKLKTWLVEAIAMTRKLSSDLSPLNIPGSTLSEVLLWLASEMKEQYGMEIEIENNSVHPALNNELLWVLLQVLRELLFNVVKHAGTQKATIALENTAKHQMRIIVSDNGKGYGTAGSHEHGGLTNIRNQLKIFGCAFEIQSARDQGTRAIISVPTRSLDTDS